MRVLVCGGRKFSDRWFLQDYLDKRTITHLIEGGSSGTDELARDWAEMNNIPFSEYPAEWGKYGKGAGPIRNQQMLTEGKPDLVIAFPGGNGTADMVRRARKAGIPVEEVAYP